MRPTIFKHRRRYGGATSAVVLRRGCNQSKHTFKFYSAEHTRIYGSGLSKTVVAVPVEVAPRARRRRVKGQSTFDRIRQPQTNFIYDIQIFYPKLLEGSYADFQIATLQQENILLPDYLLVASMNSIYYQQSELSVILEAHNLLQQSSEPRKIRGEADAISTQRPFSKFEFSHLFLRC